MRVAIIGTRGIPNHYGGFEQFAEYLSTYLASQGHTVYVYCSHNHPYKHNTINHVNLIKRFDPEYRIGTAGQFIYDLNCIIHSRKMRYDVILNLGYTSSAIFMGLFRKNAAIVTNMDGLEWKRTKYSKKVQRFLRFSERLAVKKSDLLISDSIGIQSYLKATYSVDSVYVPYGATIRETAQKPEIISEFGVEAFNYHLVIARMEPENNIEVILEGIEKSNTKHRTLVIGNYQNKFGLYLHRRFNNLNGISFIGPLYDLEKLDALRFYCDLYFHGHSVGGTNPSLLEAMAGKALICAHDNEFNRYVLNQNAFYFKTSDDIQGVLLNTSRSEQRQVFINNNLENIRTLYGWDTINRQYETILLNAVASKK